MYFYFFLFRKKIIYLSFKFENKKLEQEDFNKNWNEIEKEIQYTNIYFYFIANVILLCAPIDEGGFDNNQML